MAKIKNGISTAKQINILRNPATDMISGWFSEVALRIETSIEDIVSKLSLTTDIWLTVKKLSKWRGGHPLLGDHFKI